jgi:hypothetical protein
MLNDDFKRPFPHQEQSIMRSIYSHYRSEQPKNYSSHLELNRNKKKIPPKKIRCMFIYSFDLYSIRISPLLDENHPSTLNHFHFDRFHLVFPIFDVVLVHHPLVKNQH